METKHILDNFSNSKTKSLKQALKTTTLLTTHGSMEEWLDGVAIQSIFKISRTTLYRMRKGQLIPYTRFGGKCLYPRKYFYELLFEKALAMKKERC